MRYAILVLFGGCTWVSDEDYAARLPELDDDGDGTVAGEDCDDHNKDAFPGNVETWYDGVDENCNDLDTSIDDYDADGDGFLSAEHTGTAPEQIDCNDANNFVYPGAPETWYDNLDSDCAGDDDFDQDKDGSRAEVDRKSTRLNSSHRT